MRNLILAALAATTLAGPVLADPPGERHDDRREVRQDRHELRGDRRELRGDLRHEPPGAERAADRAAFNGDRRDYWRDRHELREDRRDLRGDRRDWRDDRRTDWRWEGPRYHDRWIGYPAGYGYRAWGVGAFLPRPYWTDRYYIGDPFAYRLPPAWRGTRWVRYGPDALLIRLVDGGIVRVVRGIFY